VRKYLIIAILLCVASMAIAEDFSVTLQKVRPWPGKPVNIAGMQSRTAPANSLTAVRFMTRGWVTGSNSSPMTVYAVPRQQENGTWWAICQVSAYCGNPGRGGWLEKKEIKPLVATVSQIETRVVERVVCAPPPVPVFPPPMVGSRQTSPGYPIVYGTRSEKWVPLVVPFVFGYGRPKCTPPETCDPDGGPGQEQNPNGQNVR